RFYGSECAEVCSKVASRWFQWASHPCVFVQHMKRATRAERMQIFFEPINKLGGSAEATNLWIDAADRKLGGCNLNRTEGFVLWG
ncbi:MAG: hypothetical protein KDE46_24125, partial [Caldilineaceae bacterium]|nr:hypothetical protein [Caldilineaceae bacterium]